MTTQWTATNVSAATYLGPLSVGDEYFEILRAANRLVFGGACNAVFLESGYMELEDGETMDEALNELIADLETYYHDGAQYVSRIVCNERM
jgi:hypothetical protein